MKCPLLKITRPGLMNPAAHPQDDCLGEECAWWIPEFERCAMTDVAVSLSAVAEHLSVIREYGPGNEPVHE